MSEKNPIRVYVTHAFAQQCRLSPRLRVPGERCRTFSIAIAACPIILPQTGGKEALKDEYRMQLKSAEVVVVLSSLYFENEYWTTYQMDAAQATNLPLVAVGPFGGSAKVPAEVAKRASRGRRLERAAHRRCRPTPGAPRRHRSLGHHRVQALARGRARHGHDGDADRHRTSRRERISTRAHSRGESTGLRARRGLSRARCRRDTRRQLVVLHDLYLDDVTDVAQRFPGRQRADGRHYVIDFDLAELETLHVFERRSAGSEHAKYPARFPFDIGILRIATLADELRLVQGLNKSMRRSVGIYPEIKAPEWHRRHGIDLSSLLLNELAAFGYCAETDPVFVQCFDAAELVRVRTELGSALKLIQLVTAEASYAELLTQAGLRRACCVRSRSRTASLAAA